MTTPYIPPKDTDYDVWANNFQTVIAATPAAYGLAAADAVAITASFNAWHTSYLAATNPATRTSVTIAAKDVQKASSLLVFRPYAQIIQNNASVTDPSKAAAGLTIRATTRTPIPAPGTSPILGFIGATPLQHTLKYSDTTTPTTKAKPFGAIHLELWRYIGTTPPAGTDAYSFYGDMTKSPFAVDFNSPDVGKQAYYIAKWATRTGLDGPWSAPLNSAIV